jgi:hypothetical protein
MASLFSASPRSVAGHDEPTTPFFVVGVIRSIDPPNKTNKKLEDNAATFLFDALRYQQYLVACFKFI